MLLIAGIDGWGLLPALQRTQVSFFVPLQWILAASAQVHLQYELCITIFKN